MRQKSGPKQSHGEKVVKDIRRATRKHYSAEEKIRIVLDGLKGEDSITELCRREGIAQSLYYSWSKEFLEAGKKRLAGDTARVLEHLHHETVVPGGLGSVSIAVVINAARWQEPERGAAGGDPAGGGGASGADGCRALCA